VKTTRKIGDREAKTRSSEWPRDVKLGRQWIVSERGKTVARLVSVSASRGDLESV
jgi:antitoxin (DNA-binding transcriptional repressor) of toxin-antitoxin stability system